MSMITSYLHRVSLKKQGNLKALLESLSYQPWEALDPKAVLNARGAISCPQFIIVMPLDWCATDACKTTTICNGLCTWTVSTARIYTSTTRSLWTTSLASSWVLDCTIIADAVTATRTGSFMDGSATPTNCKIDGGNPSITQYLHTVDVFAHPDNDQQVFFSHMVDIHEKILYYNRELES